MNWSTGSARSTCSAATLPAGTVSGAPKVRAMEIIDELEPVKRGPYAGVVGYIDWSGNLDTAIAIRTMFVRPGGECASLQAGAGIVADSVPDDEDLECRNKAAALLAAIPAARRMTAARRDASTDGLTTAVIGSEGEGEQEDRHEHREDDRDRDRGEDQAGKRGQRRHHRHQLRVLVGPIVDGVA